MTGAAQPPAIIDTRRKQAFPRLTPQKIVRLRRFGEQRTYRDGQRLFAASEPGPGLPSVVKSLVAVTRPNKLRPDVPILHQGEGEFLTEIGQHSGKPASVDEQGAVYFSEHANHVRILVRRPLEETPLETKTSVPGVFTIADMRAGSVIASTRPSARARRL